MQCCGVHGRGKVVAARRLIGAGGDASDQGLRVGGGVAITGSRPAEIGRQVLEAQISTPLQGIALDDAARIDGCGVLRSFFKIMIPAIKTGIITVVVISFLNGWNDLAYSMTFNVKPEMRPLTANIYKFQSKWGTKWNCIMAYGTILVLPVILLFVFLQKYIVGGLTAGAVKE